MSTLPGRCRGESRTPPTDFRHFSSLYRFGEFLVCFDPLCIYDNWWFAARQKDSVNQWAVGRVIEGWDWLPDSIFLKMGKKSFHPFEFLRHRKFFFCPCFSAFLVIISHWRYEALMIFENLKGTPRVGFGEGNPRAAKSWRQTEHLYQIGKTPDLLVEDGRFLFVKLQLPNELKNGPPGHFQGFPKPKE